MAIQETSAVDDQRIESAARTNYPEQRHHRQQHQSTTNDPSINPLLLGSAWAFTCKICGKSFATPQALGGHTGIHRHKQSSPSDMPGERVGNNTKLYRCQHCDAKFGIAQALGGHMGRHRNNDMAAAASKKRSTSSYLESWISSSLPAKPSSSAVSPMSIPIPTFSLLPPLSLPLLPPPPTAAEPDLSYLKETVKPGWLSLAPPPGTDAPPLKKQRMENGGEQHIDTELRLGL